MIISLVRTPFATSFSLSSSTLCASKNPRTIVPRGKWKYGDYGSNIGDR